MNMQPRDLKVFQIGMKFILPMYFIIHIEVFKNLELLILYTLVF